MKRVNGIITEATEKELLEVYLMSNWNKTCSFEQYKELMQDEGCNILEGEKECDYRTNTFVPTVQSVTLEQKTIVQENVKPIEKTTEAVMAIETSQQQIDSVNTVNTETPATTKPQTESGVKKKPVIIMKPKTQDKKI